MLGSECRLQDLYLSVDIILLFHHIRSQFFHGLHVHETILHFLVDKSQLTNKSIEIFFMSCPFVRSIMSMSSTQIYLGLELVEEHMM